MIKSDGPLGGYAVNPIADYFYEAAADKLVGLGIYEYIPSGARNSFIEKLIRFGSAL